MLHASVGADGSRSCARRARRRCAFWLSRSTTICAKSAAARPWRVSSSSIARMTTADMNGSSCSTRSSIASRISSAMKKRSLWVVVSSGSSHAIAFRQQLEDRRLELVDPGPSAPRSAATRDVRVLRRCRSAMRCSRCRSASARSTLLAHQHHRPPRLPRSSSMTKRSPPPGAWAASKSWMMTSTSASVSRSTCIICAFSRWSGRCTPGRSKRHHLAARLGEDAG